MFQTLPASTTRSTATDQLPPLSGSSIVTEEHSLPDEEVIRMAMRITTSSLSQLQIESETIGEVEILKRYIRLCPYVSPGSPAVVAALEGLDRFDGNSATTNGKKQKNPDHSPEEISSSHQEEDTQKRFNGNKKPGRRTLPSIVHFARILILDFPITLLLVAFCSVRWVHRLHDLYLKPQMNAMVWSPQRAEKENIYYPRVCEDADVTTRNPADLILSDYATVEDAYQHQLLHGFTVFPQVVSDDAASELSDFILSKNKNIADDDAFVVINNDNRYSFGLGTEEPSVVRVLKELGSNQRFVHALDRVVGTNPALFEMTAITAEYGALPQFWHMDVKAEGSSVQYGRSFGQAFSVFIPLQNTTTQMGATSVCPGMQFCAYDVSDQCDQSGFQMVGPDGFWRAGDALLMNANSQHRGAGHTDPSGLDRVLLILTFFPKPLSRGETRLLPQGSTFSIRWDMWGHTLRDLAHADKAMTKPWTILRSLGLYKGRGADWGIDFITSSSMRMANSDTGFRRSDLDKFVESGGIKWLPRFLHGNVRDDETFYDYLWKTFINVELFVLALYLCAVGSYLVFGFMFLAVSEITDGKISVTNLFRRFLLLVRRLIVVHCILYCCYRFATFHVDQTNWAKDIKAGRSYASAFAGENESEQKAVRLYSSPFIKNKGLVQELKSTFPHRLDVLIENRYTSRHFGIINDMVLSHPGNRIFNELVHDLASIYKDYPELFRDASARFIVSVVQSQQGRFLFQDWEPSWRLLSDLDAVEYTKFQLTLASNPIITTKIAREIMFLVSDYRFGIHRHTVLAHKHSVLYLKLLFQLVSGVKDLNREKPVIPHFASSKLSFRRFFSIKTNESKAKFKRRPLNLQVGAVVGPPHDTAWLKEGDVIDAMVEMADGSSCWFYAKILVVTPSGSCHLVFADRETSIFKLEFLRPFVSYLNDTTLQVSHDGIWYPAVAFADHGNGQYDVYVEALNLTLVRVRPDIFRRTVL